MSIFDFLKSPFIYFLAVSGAFFLPSINPDLAILAGLAAVAGHIKPFYLRFEGGKGVASLLGLCAITIFYTGSIYALALLTATTIYTITVSRNLTFTHPLRQLLKLMLLSLPLAAIWLPKIFIISISTTLFLLFALLDAFRLLIPQINRLYLHISIFAKQKEKHRLSGATLLFLSSFLIFWLFPKEIAIFSLTCFLLGDSLAPLGQKLAPFPLLADKTLGGAGIYFLVSFISGLFLQSLTPLDLSLPLILAASLLTATLDQFSYFVDDNLLVPVGTALILTLIV